MRPATIETEGEPQLGTGSLRDEEPAGVVWLEQPGAVRSEVTGGKGARLAELLQAGFPVPPGFVVSAADYREHERRVAGRFPAAWAEVQGGAPSATAIEAIRAALKAEPVSEPLAAQVRAAYRRLREKAGHATVAVRSSGTAEDMGDASFAGQHETFLNVRDEEEVLAAVPRCWASLWTDWAVHYRQRTAYGASAVALAVVIQEQIGAEVAGVLFTVNRVAADEGEMVLTAGYGLGDAIVSGEVTPDVFYLDKATLRVRRRIVGRKQVMTTAEREGTVTVAAGAGSTDGACLEEAQIQEVGELGRRVEAHYGQPQDLEWAWAGGRLYLLQARPITGARPGAAVLPESRRASAPPGRRAPRGLNRWYREFLTRNLADHFPDPLRPLDFTTTIWAMFVGVREVLAEVGVDTGAPERFFPLSRDGEIVFSPPLPRPTLSLLTLVFRLPGRSAVNVRRVWVEVDTPYVESRLEALRRLDPAALTGGELATAATAALDLLDEICRRRFRHFMPGVVHAILFRMLTRLAAGSGAVQARTALLGGIDHRTAKLNAELARLARDAADRPPLRRLFREVAPQALQAELEREPEAATFCAGLKRLLAEFGARGARGMLPMPSFPSWADTPVVVLGLLQAMVREAPTVGQLCSDEDELRARTALQDQLRARLHRSWRGKLRLERLFDASLDRYRGLLYVREESLWQGEILVATLRRVVLEIGRRLRLAGTIADEEDVFFLRREEIAAAVGGSLSATHLLPLISARRAQFLAWEKGAREGRNWFGLALGLAPHDLRVSAAGEVLSGLPASPGMARGRVKLVRDQTEFHRLERGDVLVCPVTTPAWTPLFSLAAAVVTDIGGPLSHAANVAREEGIPAVLGTHVATRVLHDGEVVLVDGTAGRVSRAGT